MAALTMEELLQMEPFSSGTLLAGKGGLHHEVVSISVMEVPPTEIPGYFLENQLEVTAFYSVMNDVQAQLDVVRALHQRKIAGLVLSHIGLVVKRIAPEVAQLCNELDLPLIVASPDTTYTEMISAVLDRLFYKQKQQLTLAINIYDRMSSLLLENQTYGRVVSELARTIGRQAVFFSPENQCLANSGRNLPDGYMRYITEEIAKHRFHLVDTQTSVTIPALHNGTGIQLLPVCNRHSFFGILAVLEARDITELEEMAIAQAKNALGIVALNHINLREYRSKLRDDFVYDLIHWNFADEATAFSRAQMVGYDISLLRAVIVLDIFRFNEYSQQHTEAALQQVKSRFYETIKGALPTLSPHSVFYQFSDKAVVLLTETNPRDIKKLAETLSSLVQAKLDLPIAAGVGRLCDKPLDVTTSFQDALRITKVTSRLFNEPRTFAYDDVPVFSYMAELLDRPGAGAAFERLLKPLQEYDRQHNAELMNTFESLCRNGADTLKTAEELFLHKNTILLRKKKIEALYPYNPFAPLELIQFEMAFLLRRLMNEEI